LEGDKLGSKSEDEESLLLLPLPLLL